MSGFTYIIAGGTQLSPRQVFYSELTLTTPEVKLVYHDAPLFRTLAALLFIATRAWTLSGKERLCIQLVVSVSSIQVRQGGEPSWPYHVQSLLPPQRDMRDRDITYTGPRYLSDELLSVDRLHAVIPQACQ